MSFPSQIVALQTIYGYNPDGIDITTIHASGEHFDISATKSGFLTLIPEMNSPALHCYDNASQTPSGEFTVVNTSPPSVGEVYVNPSTGEFEFNEFETVEDVYFFYTGYGSLVSADNYYNPMASGLVEVQEYVLALASGIDANESGIAAHIADTDNPHGTTYDQVGAAPTVHTHDDRYYTETEVNTLLGDLQPSGDYVTNTVFVAASSHLQGEIDDLETNDIAESAGDVFSSNKFFTRQRVWQSLYFDAPLELIPNYSSPIDSTLVGLITMPAASATASGFLKASDWVLFNSKADADHTHGDYVTNSVFIAASSYLQAAINTKENSITPGTTAQFWRGDKTWVTLTPATIGAQPSGDYVTSSTFISASSVLQDQIDDKSDIGHTHDDRYYTETEVDTLLGSYQPSGDYATNTALINASSLLSDAIDTKEDAITAGTTSQYWRGDKTWQELNTTAVAEGTNLYWTSSRFNTAFAAKTSDDLAEGSTNLYYSNERVDDRVSTLIQNGTGLTWSYNDGSNTLTANVSLTPFSTSDLSEGTNLYYTNTRADARITLQKGAANGLATLGADSKIPTSQLPALAISDTFVVANEAAMLALTAERGDVAVRTDENKSYILAGDDPSALPDWQELLTPTDTVLSVNGQTGTVVLTTSDIAEGTNEYFTEYRARNVLSSDSAALTYDAGTGTFSLPAADLGTDGYLTSSDWTTFWGKQDGSAELYAIAALSTTGILVRTGSAAYAVRSISAGSANLSVTNGSGVAGNISVDLSANPSVTTLTSSSTTTASAFVVTSDGSAASPILRKSTGSGLYFLNTNDVGISIAGSSEFIFAGSSFTFGFSGSVSAPAIGPNTDPNTGIYFPAADQLGIATGGVAGLIVAATTSTFAGSVTTGGQVLVPVGSVGAPSYSFTGDPNTGMYFPSADTLGFTTGGTLRLSISTTAVTSTLAWQGPAGSASSPSLSFSTDTNTGLYSIGADNIGIATNGTLRFDVSTTAITSTLVHLNPGGAVGAPAYSFSGDPDTGMYSTSSNTLQFATGGTAIVTIGNTSSYRAFTVSLTSSLPSGPPNVGAAEFSITQANALTPRAVSMSANYTNTSLSSFGSTYSIFAAYGTATCSVSSNAVAGVTRAVYGAYFAATNTGSDTGTASTRNTYGIYTVATADTNATSTAYGGYFTAVNGDTNIGVYASGATAAFAAGGLGSASNPAYTFFGDQNTGIYSASADTLNITTGGTLRVTVDSNGIRATGYVSADNTAGVTGSFQDYTGTERFFKNGLYVG